MEVNLISSMVASVVALVFTILGVKLLNDLWFRPKKLENFLRKQGFQGNPYKIPLGDMKDFIKVMETEQPKAIKLSDDIPSHILPYFNTTIDNYGKNSYVWFGPSPRINIGDPELIKEVLSKPETFEKPLPNPIGEMIVGGLLFLQHDKWVPRRKIVNTSFLVHKLKKMVPTIFSSCSDMIGKWETLIRNEGKSSMEMDVWPYLEDLSADVISRTAFGSNHAQGKRIFELQKEQVKLVLQMMRISFIPGWRYFPTKTMRRMKVVSGEIQSLLRGIVSQRERVMEKGENYDDLLGILMESNAREIKGGNGNKNMVLSIEDVIEECKLFYFAGSETTSNMLVWTMVMLAKHPDWQSRARQEVLQHLPKEETPTYDRINHLKIVSMIMYEVLRMYPPVPYIVRAATKTVKVGDKIIPVGAEMTLLIGNLHYDHNIWGDDANEFRPERFSKGIAKTRSSSFIPFSSGPRVCIGQNLAMIEAKLALVMMLQRFSFELSPSYRHAPFAIMTLQPQYGAPMILNNL